MMPSLPPLNLNMSSAATSGAKGGDGAFGGTTSQIKEGDWNVNFGSGSVAPAGKWGMALMVAAGVWWLARRKA